MQAIRARTLLLSGTAPGSQGVGGIILGDLAALFPPGHLSAFVMQEPGRLAGAAPQQHVIKWLEHGGRLGRGSAALLRSTANSRRELELLKAAEAQARGHGAELVWAVLDSPMAISLASRLAHRLRLPLVTTVWDDIAHNTRYFQLDRLAARQVRLRFDQALAASQACAVIGESMQAAYQQRYGVHCVVVRHGLPLDLHRPVRREPPANDPIRIGFAGSVTARSAFEALLEGLDSLGWQLDGRPIALRLMGHRFDVTSSRPRRIEVLGFQSVPATVDLLAECSLNYLPQPFEPDWAPFAELSFPTKLTTYLAAGVPLLLHTPPHGSLRGFFDRYPFGVRVDDLNPATMADGMRRLLGDPEQYRQAGEVMVRTLREEFTEERFHTDFRAVMARATASGLLA